MQIFTRSTTHTVFANFQITNCRGRSCDSAVNMLHLYIYLFRVFFCFFCLLVFPSTFFIYFNRLIYCSRFPSSSPYLCCVRVLLLFGMCLFLLVSLFYLSFLHLCFFFFSILFSMSVWVESVFVWTSTLIICCYHCHCYSNVCVHWTVKKTQQQQMKRNVKENEVNCMCRCVPLA